MHPSLTHIFPFIAGLDTELIEIFTSSETSVSDAEYFQVRKITFTACVLPLCVRVVVSSLVNLLCLSVSDDGGA